MAGGNALGDAGGTGGEHNINRILIDGGIADSGKYRLVRLFQAQLLIGQHAPGKRTRCDQCIGTGAVVPVADQQTRGECVQNLLHACRGHCLVQRRVKAPRPYNAEKGGNFGGGALHQHGDRFPTVSQSAECRADATGSTVQLPEG